MINIVLGSTKKVVSSETLAAFFASNISLDGFLYIGYPIVGTAEGAYPIDAILISKQTGLVLFNIIEGKNLDNYQENQDDVYNKLEAKLRLHKNLMKGRNLQVNISVVTFAPALNNLHDFSDTEYPVCNESNLKKWIENISWHDNGYYEAALAVIQSISTIRKGKKKRDVSKPDSRGTKLKNLEDSIANLDNKQGRAVIETVDGVQRIRGLAGSGKTIVLALKAAYLHSQHPEWKIAVTFNTRSLKGQFRQLINTFTIEQTNDEPDWENLNIIHAWGAPGGGERDGIYYKFCQLHNIEYFDFGMAKNQWRGNEFKGVCQVALESITTSKPCYDAILIDEAQDFPPEFLKLCYEMLSEPKRLVYAYDELQNLSSQSLPSPEEIFGNNPDGTARVIFSEQKPGKPQQDIILEKCYRNSRPILVTAHALGFGIYRTPNTEDETGLVQIFENSHLWNEVGYQTTEGSLADNSHVTLERTEESSPSFLESHSPINDLISFHKFNSASEQATWVVEEIKKNLDNDELRHDDIVVINPDPLTTRKSVSPIRTMLYDIGINSHLAGVDTSPDVFFDYDNDSVAFTGIYRAKGNEAGMIYIINAHDCYSSFGSIARVRNRLFTAITRSKGWVRVLGIGPQMDLLINEYEKVRENDFKLKFRYPTSVERKHLNIVNRDMTEHELMKINQKKNDIGQILDDIEAGRMFIEDLGSEQLNRLKSLLNRESN